MIMSAQQKRPTTHAQKVLHKIDCRLVAGDHCRKSVWKSSSEFCNLGLFWPFSLRFYVFSFKSAFQLAYKLTLEVFFYSWSRSFGWRREKW